MVASVVVNYSGGCCREKFQLAITNDKSFVSANSGWMRAHRDLRASASPDPYVWSRRDAIPLCTT